MPYAINDNVLTVIPNILLYVKYVEQAILLTIATTARNALLIVSGAQIINVILVTMVLGLLIRPVSPAK